MNTFFHEKKNTGIWYVGFCLYVGMILFLVVSLVSYNVTDSSWLYITSEPGEITNQGGFVGAQISALLYYLFGGASFLLLIPLLCVGLIALTKKSMRSDWERLCACTYLVIIGAIVLTTYGIDLAWSPYPGGTIGLLGAQKLLYYFDPLGRALFLYMSLCASLVLVFRWSFMFVVQQCIAAVVAVYVVMKKYHVVSRTVQAIGVCLHSFFVWLPLLLIRFVQSLFDGRAFQDTGLMHPDDVYEEEFDFIDVEQQKPIKLNFFVASLPNRVSGKKGDVVITYLVLQLPLKNNEHVADALDDYADFMENTEIQQKKPLSTITKKAPRYALPHMNIFVAEKHVSENHDVEKKLQNRAHVLQDKLKRFGVNGEVTAIKRGPVVTLFEYQPDIDTKLSKIIVLEDDLAMALQAMSIRIIAPIPGRSVVGFEVSNTTRHDVLFSQITNQSAYTQVSGSLPLVLGKGTIGEAVVVDLARMPHLLIAGSTGSGKSVALNAILISLLCKLSPDDLKLILIDPKRLEFAAFTDIAHLLFPIVTSPHQAAPVLRWVVQEMEERYEKW